MATIFFTGFPGFLGAELLPRVLTRGAGDAAVCLVQPQYASLARRRVERIVADHPGFADRIRLVEGDITRAGLGLADAAGLAKEVVEVFHLAAVYDLSVTRELGLRVNVDGTRHVLDFAKQAPGLRRFQYVSTCYVSGRYTGIFGEDDLEKGQRFNNYYEETKHLAEVDVRRRMADGLPATIYRPSIVVGDSRTGETQKYDGPYYVLQWLLRQPGVAVMPVMGDPTITRLNVVPRDFVVDAMAWLSGQALSEGRCYALADPEPLTIEEYLEEFARATGKRLVKLPLPRKLAQASMRRLPALQRFMGIPVAATDYFAHPTFYLTTNAQRDLEGSGLSVPPFPTYLDALVAYMKAHPEIDASAMV